MPPATQRILTATAAAGRRRPAPRPLPGRQRCPSCRAPGCRPCSRPARSSGDGVLIAEGSARVKPGQTLRAAPAASRSRRRPQPEDLALDVLYEDEHLLVLDKPAGHGGASGAGPRRAARWSTRCSCALRGARLSGIGGVLRPGIVHRLDKEVSGLMVVAKDDRAHVGLAGQFSVHRIERGYEAIVWGVPAPPAGSDRAADRPPSARSQAHGGGRGRQAGADPLSARWRRPARSARRLQVELATGRTHQIRVHLGALGLGIVGDPVYRPRRRPPIGPALRGVSRRASGGSPCTPIVLGFEHPISGERLRFERAGAGGLRPAVRAALAAGARFIHC